MLKHLKHLKYLVKSPPNINKAGYEFKAQYSFEKRKDESNRLISKYPTKIPIILERATISNIPKINKQKMLIQKELTVGQIILIIRRELNLDLDKPLFIIVGNDNFPQTSKTIGEIYDIHKDSDGFLYITYSSEQIF